MEYRVVSEKRIIELWSQVNRLIKAGFVPQGGVSFTGNYYIQAMVKNSKGSKGVFQNI